MITGALICLGLSLVFGTGLFLGRAMSIGGAAREEPSNVVSYRFYRRVNFKV